MSAGEHCNDQNICLFYYLFTIVGRCQIFILKKTGLIRFVKIKPRHPDRLKNTDLGGKNQQWEP